MSIRTSPWPAIANVRDRQEGLPRPGWAHGGGYLVRATGPVLVGAVYGVSGGWTAPLVLLMALLVPQLVAGCRAGRGLVGEASAVIH
jgi:cyanate permease